MQTLKSFCMLVVSTKIEKTRNCRAASESQWDEALLGLAGKVLNTPSELHAWLAAALDAMSRQCIAGGTHIIWHTEAEWLPHILHGITSAILKET